jgi:very-short-patch-repair endonuclease
MERECRLTASQAEQLDTRPDVLVARLAARQRGVLHVEELRACGLTHQAIAVRVRNGRLHPLYRAVYAVGHANISREGWWLAAVKACGGHAALARHSMAVHLGLIAREDRYPDVLVLGTSVPVHPGINAHRTSYLPPHHVTVHRGIPGTTAERTLLDLAGVLPAHRLRRAVRQAQFLKLTTVGSLAAALHGPGPRRGRAKLARIIATGAAPTQSELEDAVLDLLLRNGFAHPLVNEPLFIGARRIVPDFRWPEQRLVIEADGPHHDDPLARADDLERQALLEAHGDQVVRVTWEQAIASQRETLRRFAAAGAPRVSTDSA